MDRRTFLMTSAAATATLAVDSGPAWAATGGIGAAFDAIFAKSLDQSPQLTTSLGLAKGARAAANSKLDDNSPAGMQARLQAAKDGLAAIGKFRPADLSPADALNREVVTYSLDQQTVSYGRFGLGSVQRPYRIFQQGGAYFSTPDFLNTAHSINAKEDCEAYLARLTAFATSLDTDSEVQKSEAARGYLAPGWSIDLTLVQMAKLREQPAATSSIVQSLVKRAAAKGIAGDWQTQATKIVESAVYPALDRQIALMKSLRPTTAEGDGVWRTPKGLDIYAAALKQATTTDLTPEQVHKMGLDQVAEIGAELDTILKALGMTAGSVGERLAKLNVDAAQLYPDTPEGKTALIEGLNQGVRAMQAKLPQAFATVPDVPLEIRAVPAEIQDGASNGYYNRAALDGSRPAIYFINLKDVGDWPKYSLPSLTYHEGVPGHHLQISIAQLSQDIPMIRKIGFMSAYSEGWALYAEKVADELGGYANPLERAGFLQSFLFRAARLVIDTGIHTKKWSREQATDYMVQTTGFAKPRSQREVERYCTQPGQACSYKVGHGVWTKARADTEKLLGAKFDLKQFHEILKEGAMPLSILERRIAERAQLQMKG